MLKKQEERNEEKFRLRNETKRLRPVIASVKIVILKFTYKLQSL